LRAASSNELIDKVIAVYHPGSPLQLSPSNLPPLPKDRNRHLRPLFDQTLSVVWPVGDKRAISPPRRPGAKGVEAQTSREASSLRRMPATSRRTPGPRRYDSRLAPRGADPRSSAPLSIFTTGTPRPAPGSALVSSSCRSTGARPDRLQARPTRLTSSTIGQESPSGRFRGVRRDGARNAVHARHSGFPRTSGGHLFGLPVSSSSQEMEPPGRPGRYNVFRIE